jgi:predicted MFS family arabinose efflux permease
VPPTSNPRLLVGLAGLQFVLFPIPIITLFWKDQIGMSVTDIMLLQAVFGLAVVCFQLPSGYFADRSGYRKSLAAGAVLLAAGWLVYTRAARFATVMIAEVVLGAGSAFISGADRALLWVSLDAAGQSRQYTRWEGRARAVSQTSEAVSAAIGGWLYALGPRWPFRLQIPVALGVLGLVSILREAPRPGPAARRPHLERAVAVVRHALWHHRRLPAAMALGVMLGLSTFVIVWLIQPYMQHHGIPTAWFGLLWAAAHAWLAATSLASARIVDALGTRATLLGCCLLVALGYAGLAMSASAWGVLFYLCFMTVRGLQGPILARVMQEDAPADDRASVLSLAALLFRLAFVVTGPPIGALVDRAGLSTALGAMAVLFTAGSLVAWAAFARAHRGGDGCPLG